MCPGIEYHVEATCVVSLLFGHNLDVLGNEIGGYRLWNALTVDTKPAAMGH